MVYLSKKYQILRFAQYGKIGKYSENFLIFIFVYAIHMLNEPISLILYNMRACDYMYARAFMRVK